LSKDKCCLCVPETRIACGKALADAVSRYGLYAGAAIAAAALLSSRRTG